MIFAHSFGMAHERKDARSILVDRRPSFKHEFTKVQAEPGSIHPRSVACAWLRAPFTGTKGAKTAGTRGRHFVSRPPRVRMWSQLLEID